MHWFPAAHPTMPSWLRDAYGWSEQLVFEAPLVLPPGITLPVGTQLLDMLPADLAAAMSRDLPAPVVAHIQQFKPWWAMFILMSAMGGQLAPGVEKQFLEWAGTDSKTASYLEEPETVPRLLDAVALEEFANVFRFLVANQDASRQHIEAAHQAWLRRDLNGMLRARAAAGLSQFVTLDRVLVDRRTLDWLPAIEALLSSAQRTLVAVGALHLHGDHGLPALLTAAGYSVTQLA